MKPFAPREDYRVVVDLLWAKRLDASPWGKARGSNAAAKLGLTYERRVGKELLYHGAKGRFTALEHNPWFQFADFFGRNACAPDFVAMLPDGTARVIEVKLTWVAVAMPKLMDLYIPVVEKALGVRAYPLVICRALAPGAPPPAPGLHESLNPLSASHLLVYPANGHIPW